MVTDAAGTGFEIKKPHKGTETLLNKCKHTPNLYLELGNPMRGQKTIIRNRRF